ncbi:MAG: cell division protein ZapB [Lentisphaerales bacterium]|nr:cell division protein ZapB [Lentisphaerales bacterium]
MKSFTKFITALTLAFSTQFVGAQSGNTKTGTNAGVSITTGDYNVMNGYSSGRYTNSGSNNTFIGTNSGRDNTNGYDNTFIGRNAGHFNTGGLYNTFIGRNAGLDNTVGRGNTAIGRSAGQNLTTGDFNNFLGMQSGDKITTGNYNLILGHKAGYLNIEGSSNVFLGKQSGYNELGSNKLYIENSNSTSPLIYGEFDNDLVQVNGALRVTGELLATSVKVKLQENWPDYVFAKDYKLASLEEVEKHIEEKKHLPGIPSAKDIEENGLELDKVVTKQMQKIEELTLYLIEMKKENEKLKEQNTLIQEQNILIQKENKDKDQTLNSILERLQALEKNQQPQQ